MNARGLVLLVLLAACGHPTPATSPDPDPDPTPATAACPDEGWGGWNGEGFDGGEACAETAALVIAGADRGCDSDADCALLGTNCDPHAVSTAAAAEYQSWPSPCTHPASGECMGPCGATCVEGCCQPGIDRC